MAPDMEIVGFPESGLDFKSRQPPVGSAAQVCGHRYRLGVSEPAERAGHVPFHSGAGRNLRPGRTGSGAGE